MSIELAITIIGLLQAVSVAIISGLFSNISSRQKLTERKTDERAGLRAEESKLSMRLHSASVALAVATASAVKGGKVNGEMETALDEAKKAQRDYYDFVNGVAARGITK